MVLGTKSYLHYKQSQNHPFLVDSIRSRRFDNVDSIEPSRFQLIQLQK